MKCVECGHVLERTEGIHQYAESGLKNVTLLNVPMYKCSQCGATDVEIPCMEELHLLIGFVLVLQTKQLSSDEAKYLRKHMRYSQEDLANYLGVTRLSVTRWEGGRTVGLSHDKALRRLYFERKSEEWQKLPEIQKILKVLVDRLPAPKPQNKIKLRKEDWVRPNTDLATCGT